MNVVFDKTLSRSALEDVLDRNSARVTVKSPSTVVYRLSSGARGEVTPAGFGQFRLRVLAPPGCACMK